MNDRKRGQLITFRNTDVSEEVDEEDIQSTEGIKVNIVNF